jgi:dTDP-4-amino-4,6-dideoxygalactose transaminase
MGFGEGGFIVTDSKYEEELNQILGFGFDGLSKKRISHSLSSNFKISDVASASILQHLKRYDMSKHIEVQDGLIEQISQIAGLEIFNYHPGVVYGNLPLIYDNNINTDFFRDSGLEAQKYYYPLKRHKNSFKLYNRIINLPLHCDLQEYEVEKIIKIVRKSVK